MNNAIFFGIIFGLISSCTLNLGKTMQKQGIELFEKQKIAISTRAKKGAIWVTGSTLSFIQPVLKTVGITILQGNATIYSSMLGVGIVIVFLYSSRTVVIESFIQILIITLNYNGT